VIGNAACHAGQGRNGILNRRRGWRRMVVDGDPFDRVAGALRCFGNDHGDGLADEADTVTRQQGPAWPGHLLALAVLYWNEAGDFTQVNTASTCGIRRASLRSKPRISAWAQGDRRKQAWTVPGGVTSPMKRPGR
jgi:hypothetical protein